MESTSVSMGPVCRNKNIFDLPRDKNSIAFVPSLRFPFIFSKQNDITRYFNIEQTYLDTLSVI